MSVASLESFALMEVVETIVESISPNVSVDCDENDMVETEFLLVGAITII